MAFNLQNLQDAIDEIPTNHELGQYFTTNITLKSKVYEFIANSPTCILEPSVGRGDLVEFTCDKMPDVVFDMYEIDTTIKMLSTITGDVKYGDFMKQNITKKYSTIIGNPPYVRTKNGNLYIDFVKKCYNLLEDSGELIFIVPSDFLKLTSAASLLDDMITNGTITHIYHPNDEKLFANACIDVIVFRYCKDISVPKEVLYNGKKLYVSNSSGLITFNETRGVDCVKISDLFDVYVGLVTGKESVYKNPIGNIEVLNGENRLDKYIYIESFPSTDKAINEHLLAHKSDLINRKIRKFNDTNWYQWGAPRNISTIRDKFGKTCIYVRNLTRHENIAFTNKVQYFGGGLIMLIPKKECDISNITRYLNSKEFKLNFMFSERFKIGHRQISNSLIPKSAC